MKRHNPIPQAWGTSPMEFVDQDSPNENLDGEDLRDANLKGSNLSGSSFRNADLSGAVLYGCDLRNCDFTGAKLDGANLGLAHVEGAVFDDCSMVGVLLFDPAHLDTVGSFNPSNLTVAALVIDLVRSTKLVQLVESDDEYRGNIFLGLAGALLGVDLNASDLNPYTFVTFSGVDYKSKKPLAKFVVFATDSLNLKGLNLAWVDFSSWYQESIKLRGANLYQADLETVELPGADLQGAYLEGAYMGGGHFDGADLQGANLQRANLKHAEFEGANLKGSNLQSANLFGANFQDADLTDADFTGTDLRDADFTDADLQRAKYNEDTTFRDGGGWGFTLQQYESMAFVDTPDEG